MSEASKVPLEHMFNNHDNCSAEWYFKTRAPEQGNSYNNKDDEFPLQKKPQPYIQTSETDSFPVPNIQFLKRITAYN